MAIEVGRQFDELCEKIQAFNVELEKTSELLDKIGKQIKSLAIFNNSNYLEIQGEQG